MIWNFDISQAPKGRTETVSTGKTDKHGQEVTKRVHVSPRIIAAGNDKVVTLSRWLPEQERWEMFSKECPPKAWMPWPAHPDEA